MSIRILKTRILKPISAAIVLTAIALCAPAHAGEPRPWLCRDKPVFSSEHMMNYDLSARAGLQWQIFFMTYDPNSAHDGFEITDSKEVGLRGVTQTGKLSPAAISRPRCTVRARAYGYVTNTRACNQAPKV